MAFKTEDFLNQMAKDGPDDQFRDEPFCSAIPSNALLQLP